MWVNQRRRDTPSRDEVAARTERLVTEIEATTSKIKSTADVVIRRIEKEQYRGRPA